MFQSMERFLFSKTQRIETSKQIYETERIQRVAQKPYSYYPSCKEIITSENPYQKRTTLELTSIKERLRKRKALGLQRLVSIPPLNIQYLSINLCYNHPSASIGIEFPRKRVKVRPHVKDFIHKRSQITSVFIGIQFPKKRG